MPTVTKIVRIEEVCERINTCSLPEGFKVQAQVKPFFDDTPVPFQVLVVGMVHGPEYRQFTLGGSVLRTLRVDTDEAIEEWLRRMHRAFCDDLWVRGFKLAGKPSKGKITPSLVAHMKQDPPL